MGWERRGYGSYGGYGYGGFAPYVPVAQRKANAARYAQKVAKKEGRELAPVNISGRVMATTFWGKAWCDNLEAYSDFANRLPRGRTYARNGSVIDLQIKPGKIAAIVAGSDVYTISISIETLAQAAWTRLKGECSQSIASLIDLLQGRFDSGVMQRLTHPTEGLFPRPKEIKMQCSCPDYAGLCKHLAAVLYGVGNRLDNSPEMLFTLRNVDHLELVSQAVAEGNLDRTLETAGDKSLAGSDLEAMFGIELDKGNPASKKHTRAKKSTATERVKSKTATTAKARGKKPVQVKAKIASKPVAAKGTRRKVAAPSMVRRKAR